MKRSGWSWTTPLLCTSRRSSRKPPPALTRSSRSRRFIMSCRLAAFAATLALTGLLAGCGGGDDAKPKYTPYDAPPRVNPPPPTRLDREGYDPMGYDRDGYDHEGYDRQGYNRQGYNRDGFDRLGYSNVGYTRDGFDRDGFG